MTRRLFKIPWIKILSPKTPTFTLRGPSHFNCVCLEKIALSEGRQIQIHQLGKSLLLEDPGYILSYLTSYEDKQANKVGE